MRRRGLVIGAGGVLGLTWIALALQRLEREEGWDPRTAEAIVGTSAGSMTAALLGSGCSTADLMTLQLTGRLPGVHVAPTGDGRAYPPLPVPLPASPVLAISGLLRFRSPVAAAIGALPEGREPMPGVRNLVTAVLPDGGWVDHPRTCVVAMDYRTGRRVAFGRPDHPPAQMVDAVAASCSIPGWFAPVTINGRRYVDGGVRSSTNADLLSREGLDEVIVVAPMTSPDRPRARDLAEHAERAMRWRMSRQLDREIRRLQAGGTTVRRIEPTLAELDAMGANFMDPRRRRDLLTVGGAETSLL